jgi:hypothetical protein
MKLDPGNREANRVQLATAFLNLLPDSRLHQAFHASAFIKAPARRGVGMGERNLGLHQPSVRHSQSVSFNRGQNHWKL